jgi:hypothetical protein
MRLEPGRDNLLSMRDDVAHTKLRNKMAAGVSSVQAAYCCFADSCEPKYSGKENESMEGSIDRQISNLVRLIETKYLSTTQSYKPMDFGQKAQYFTLDVISDLAFGQAFGYLEKDDDVFDYIKITSSYIPIMLVLANVPSLVNLLHSRLLRGLLPTESDKLGFGAFIG